MYKFINLLMLSLVIAGCGGGSEQKQEPQSAAVVSVISPIASSFIVGDTISLNGGQSQGGAGQLSYSWTLTDKPAGSVVQINTTSAQLQFVADMAGEYLVSLEVSALGQRHSSSIRLQVNANQSPELKLADLSDQTLILGSSWLLDASLSTDPEQRALSFNWQLTRQPQGSALQLATGSKIEFNPKVAGAYTIVLEVSDGYNKVQRQLEWMVYRTQSVLQADLASGQSAAAQLTSFFGEGSLDLPLTHAKTQLTPTQTAEHLQLATNAEAGDHFVLLSHVKLDGDRAVLLSDTDRQRTEFKSYNQSPESLVCRQGDQLKVAYLMKADDLKLSTSFTHLFQLKGQSELPLFTLSAQRTDTVEALRLRYQPENRTLAAVAWEKVNNRWLDVSMAFQCAEQGYLKVKIKDLQTGELYMDFSQSAVVMWQGVSDDVYGIKAGIYRKVKENCTPSQPEAATACSDTEIKKGLDNEQDSLRIGRFSISKL